MHSTLLEKAKQFKTSRKIKIKFSDEEMELFIAWAKDEISLTQFKKAMNLPITGVTCYTKLTFMARQYIRNGNK